MTTPNKNTTRSSQAENWNQQYRPRHVADLHLASVREAFLSLMAAPHFPQTLLFAGPKGTGKTSVARILGAMLNDPANDSAVEQRFFSKKSGISKPLLEPDKSSSLSQSIFSGQSYVVQELDAASNRGIDDVRLLKERSALPPSQGRVAVYILDEVHMLTIEAFNALLKLLEEPPQHVVFVLATTELHKLPATIVSRCHLIRFHKASPKELLNPLKTIITDQQLTIPAESLELIATIADGSFRDAVKLLQQFVHQGSTTGELSKLTETLSDENLTTLIQAVIDKKPSLVVREIEQLRQQGANEQHFLHSLVHFLHQDVLKSLTVVEGKNHFNEKIARFFLQQLTHPDLLKPAPIPFLRFELALLELIDRAKSKAGTPSSSDPSSQRENKNEGTSTKKSAKKIETSSASSVEALTEESDIILIEPSDIQQMMETVTVSTPSLPRSSDSDKLTNSLKPLGDGQLLCEKWPELIAKASDFNFGLAALLRSAKPIGGGDGEVVVRVYYTFHKEQLLQQKWRHFWDELTTDIVGGVVALDCVVEKLSQEELTHASQLQPVGTLEALAVDALMH
ncbi:DNA polymerase III subunit gamma/tau [Candidatus Woesebacteria bacterium]|nr:DNA polymerase III subunit gamma/tau [Candidatus Woesebacteria bacterium]